jgi:hypothetical protein
VEGVKSLSQISLKANIPFWLSAALLLAGMVSWVPYLVFNVQEPFGMLTFVMNPIGFFLGYVSNNRLLALSNLLMVFSIVPVFIYVYLKLGYIPM